MTGQRRVCTTALAVGLFAAINSAAAQTIDVKAGVSFATIVFLPEGTDTLPGGSSIARFVGGVSFMPLPSDRGGVQIELLLHQKGVRNLLRRDDRIRLTYIEVPVLLHVDVAQQPRGAVFIVGGPVFGWNTAASYEDDGVVEDASNEIADFDFGLAAGAGIEHRRLSVEARYTWGLRTVFRDGDLNGAFKNRTLTLTAGWRLGR